MKKNIKGFTITEVIVAFAILAVMALLVCTLYAGVNSLIINSDKTSDKIDNQKTTYENGLYDTAADDTISKQVTFKTATNTATVDVEMKVIEGKVPNTRNDPNIAYFTKD